MRGGWLGHLLRTLRLAPAESDAAEPAPARLVVGLGNPGPDYAGTRHNAGFLVADAVAEKLGAEFEQGRGPFVLARGAWEGVPVAVAKPAGVYMNHSGRAVVALLKRFGLEDDAVLVVYDDLALDLGTIRLRAKGGGGGHNGVQDIINRLNSPNFPRLRVGIGSSFARGGQVDFVLSPFEPEEEPVIEEAVERAAEAALAFTREGITAAMNRYNRRG